MGRAHRLLGGVAIFVIFCAVVVAGYAYFFKNMNPFGNDSGKKAYLKEVETALSTHSDRNYDASIGEFEKLLQNSPDTATTALIKGKLGVNLVNKGLATGGDEADVKKGMDMLWAVALDTSLHDRVRANTFADLASIYMTRSGDFYISMTPYPPFHNFVTEANKNDPMAVQRAALKLYQYSDETYGNPYAKFGIVFQYTNLIGGKGLEQGVTEKEAATLIQRYIVEGDAALATDSNYGEGTIALMMLNRAKGLALSNLILNNKKSDEIETAFKKAIETNASSKNKYVTDAQMEARFWYAAYLHGAFNEGRLDDVLTILQPFSSEITPAEKYLGTRSMFVHWNKAPYSNFGQQRAIGLAGVSPIFKSFLQSVGWAI